MNDNEHKYSIFDEPIIVRKRDGTIVQDSRPHRIWSPSLPDGTETIVRIDLSQSKKEEM